MLVIFQAGDSAATFDCKPVAAFCEANADRLTTAVFGVSALGGRIPEDKEELLRKGGVFGAYSRDATGVAVPVARVLEWAVFP